MDFGKTIKSLSESNISIKKKDPNFDLINLEMKNSILKEKFERAKKTILNFEKKEALNSKLLDLIIKNINKLGKRAKLRIFGFFEKDLKIFGKFDFEKKSDFGKNAKSTMKGLFAKLVGFLRKMDFGEDSKILNLFGNWKNDGKNKDFDFQKFLGENEKLVNFDFEKNSEIDLRDSLMEISQVRKNFELIKNSENFLMEKKKTKCKNIKNEMFDKSNFSEKNKKLNSENYQNENLFENDKNLRLNSFDLGSKKVSNLNMVSKLKKENEKISNINNLKNYLNLKKNENNFLKDEENSDNIGNYQSNSENFENEEMNHFENEKTKNFDNFLLENYSTEKNIQNNSSDIGYFIKTEDYNLNFEKSISQKNSQIEKNLQITENNVYEKKEEISKKKKKEEISKNNKKEEISKNKKKEEISKTKKILKFENNLEFVNKKLLKKSVVLSGDFNDEEFYENFDKYNNEILIEDNRSKEIFDFSKNQDSDFSIMKEDNTEIFQKNYFLDKNNINNNFKEENLILKKELFNQKSFKNDTLDNKKSTFEKNQLFNKSDILDINDFGEEFFEKNLYKKKILKKEEILEEDKSLERDKCMEKKIYKLKEQNRKINQKEEDSSEYEIISFSDEFFEKNENSFIKSKNLKKEKTFKKKKKKVLKKKLKKKKKGCQKN